MNSINTQIKVLGLVLLACLPISSSAAIIVSSYVDGSTDYTAYPMPNLVSSPPITVSGLDQTGNGESSANITRNEFGVSNPTPDGLQWLLWRTASMNSTPSSTDDYFEFSLEADPGELHLDELSFRMVLAKASTSNFTVNYEVFARKDGGTFNSFGTGSMTHSGANNTFTTPVTQNIDLSSITGATTADIRIAWGGTASSSAQALFVQDIQMTVAIPEPSALSLLGLGVMLLGCRKKFRCNSNPAS